MVIWLSGSFCLFLFVFVFVFILILVLVFFVLVSALAAIGEAYGSEAAFDADLCAAFSGSSAVVLVEFRTIVIFIRFLVLVDVEAAFVAEAAKAGVNIDVGSKAFFDYH